VLHVQVDQVEKLMTALSARLAMVSCQDSAW
jgi:hypothetical protein